MKVVVAGLGTIGLPTAEYIASAGPEVMGYDVNAGAVQRALARGIAATTEWSDVPPADVFVICVSTHYDAADKLNQVRDVRDLYTRIALLGGRKKLVSIESTVPPGTCRLLSRNIHSPEIQLVHAPHRYWPADPVHHGVRQPRVIAGIDEQSLTAGLDFYVHTLDIPMHQVSSIEIAEVTKVGENAYRFIQIAYAQELNDVCSSLGIAFEEVRKACNTKWNVELLDARDGIKGACLPKDTAYLADLTEDASLIKAALVSNQLYSAKCRG